MKKLIALVPIIVSLALLMSCGETPKTDAVSCEANGDTPTAAYKRLFDAVKSKNTEAIKSELSKATLTLGEMTAERYKKSLESTYENGFTATTFSPMLPEMRDERVKCNMGALEVWNSQEQKWEDLPFLLEDGKWKLALGDIFKGSFESPGRGMAYREAEAANAARGNVPPPTTNVNANSKPVALSNTNSNRATNRTGAK